MSRGRRVNSNVFWFRVASAILLFGSLIALGTVTYGTVKTFAQNSYLADEDRYVKEELSRNMYTPVEQRIAKHEELIAKLKNPVSIAEERQKLASFYEELGNESLAQNNLPLAEESYLRALNLHPNEPVYATRVAHLYEQSAERETNTAQKISYLQDSVTYWRSAAEREQNSERQMQYADNVVRAMLRLGEALALDGQVVEARQEIQEVKETAPPGSKWGREADKLAWELDGDFERFRNLRR